MDRPARKSGHQSGHRPRKLLAAFNVAKLLVERSGDSVSAELREELALQEAEALLLRLEELCNQHGGVPGHPNFEESIWSLVWAPVTTGRRTLSRFIEMSAAERARWLLE